MKNARWLQRDPSGYADGANLYESFGGNPGRNADPNGTDDVFEEGQDLVYETQGFTWTFARGISPHLVLIDHPHWPFAFVMKRADAKELFDTGPFESDFYSPLEIMQKASSIATASSLRSSMVAIFPKESYQNYPGGWAVGTALDPADEQKLQELAQGGLQRAVGDIGQVTAVAFTVSMGALAAPAGFGGMIVEAGAAAGDVASGRISSGTGVVVLTAMVAGAALPLRVADDWVAAARRVEKGAVGAYEDVGGHHVHAQAAFGQAVTYDPGKGFAISYEFMNKQGWAHELMTTRQQQLFRELARSGRANTLKEHSRIAVEALMAAGAPEAEARSLVAQSLRNLREQGVRFPTEIPWGSP